MSRYHWAEVADRVFVRRHDYLEVNCGLVLGEERCLVVDTGWDEHLGRMLAESVRGVTALPWDVVLTHAHFDHAYGTAAFLPARVWGHPGCAWWLSENSDQTRARVLGELHATGQTELAASIENLVVVAPDHLVQDRASIDLGGRTVHLMYGGRGHTDHDLVVAVPDASAVFWGDLVEVGADPAYEDGFPWEWGTTLSRLLDTVEAGLAVVSVPGHGHVVGRDVVEEQCSQHQRLAWFLGEGMGAGEHGDIEALVRRGLGSGFTEETVRRAVERLGA